MIHTDMAYDIILLYGAKTKEICINYFHDKKKLIVVGLK